MKNNQKPNDSTKQKGFNNKPYQNKEIHSNDQFSEITTIGSEIIEVVQSELNSVETQILLKNYMEILRTLQSEVVSTLEKGKYQQQQQQIENLFNKNYDVITNYFIQCLQTVDNVKSSSVELLSNCLNQLFQILSNDLKKKELEPQQIIENHFGSATSLISKEENFVFLINSLSTAIKSFMKSSKNIIKEMSSQSNNTIEELTQNKLIVSELSNQLNSPSITKSTQKIMNNNLKTIMIKIDYISQINKEIQNETKLIDDFSIKFYDEAKDIFHKLKALHNEKMINLTRLSNEYCSSVSLTNTPFTTVTTQVQKKDKKRNQSVSPTHKKIIENNNNTRNINKNNKTGDELTPLSNYYLGGNQQTFPSKEKSKSTDNWSKGVQKRVQSKPLNISNSNVTSSTTHYGTSPNITQNRMLGDLNERNSELKQEIEKINEENKQLRHSLSKLKQSLSMSKDTLPRLANANNNNPNVNQSSSALKDIANNKNSIYDTTGLALAMNTLSFINNMKELQNSICQKAPNIVEMKKDFEKQKKDLIQLATVIQLSSSSSSVNCEPNNNNQQQSTKQLKKQTKMNNAQSQESAYTHYGNEANNNKNKLKEENIILNKTCKDYESVIKNLGEQLNERTNELAKISSDLQKTEENKKRISNPAKIKELENKITAYKSENEQLKSSMSSLQKKMKENNNNNSEQNISDSNSNINQNIVLIIKENEELKKAREEMKTENEKLKKSYEDKAKQLSQFHESNTIQVNQLKIERDSLDNKCTLLQKDVSYKEKEVSQLNQIKLDLEKESKDITNKLTQIQSEVMELRKANERIKGDNDKLNQELSQFEKQTKSNQTDSISQNTLLSKLKAEVMNYQKEISQMKEDSIKQMEKNQNAIADYKMKMIKKENELNEMKKALVNIDKENNANELLHKKDQPPSAAASYKQEFIETSQMLHKVKEMFKEKYNELSMALTMNEMNQNDAFLFDENNDNEDEEYEKELKKISSNPSVQQLSLLKKRNEHDISSIDNILMQVFELIKSNLKLDDDEDKEDIKILMNDNKNHRKENELKDSGDLNAKVNNNNDKTIKELNNEIAMLKNFFTECTNTIFESIKVTAPHMIDEESELSFNIVSGNNIPLNIMDSKISLSGTQSPLRQSHTSVPPVLIDQEYISAAVAKFKNFNSEINQELKRLQTEKEELEKEAHSNLIKAQAYKSALDDAIAKINVNTEDLSVKYVGINNDSGNHIKEQQRAFTLEDLDNGPKKKGENNDPQEKKEEYMKINSDLLLIQTDLLKKLELQEEEQQKLQKTINNLLTLKDTNQQIQISEGKYKQLLQLYCNEQDKNNELRESYHAFINHFNDNVLEDKNKEPLISNFKSTEKKIKAMSLNQDNDDEIEDEEEFNVEEEFKNKSHPVLLNRNATHQEIKKLNHNKDYLGMLNDHEIISNHSANVQEMRIQELLNENKNHEEQEELIMTQLTAVKKELKETRDLVTHITSENNKLKEQLNQSVLFQKEEVLGPLRNALERLILEITLSPKIKEFITVILRIVGYNDDQILLIYQGKEKKKGFFNKFK